MNIISGYIYLFLAIIFGVLSSGYLKTTDNFSNIIPTIFCIITIISCIFCLSKTMNILPVGFTYATYGGMTITGVTLFSIFKYNQVPNIYGVLGIFFIVIGVWHGSGLNYLIFGLIHGLGVIINFYYSTWLKNNLSKNMYKKYLDSTVIKIIATALTFIYVSISLFFFANDISTMKIILASIK